MISSIRPPQRTHRAARASCDAARCVRWGGRIDEIMTTNPVRYFSGEETVAT